MSDHKLIMAMVTRGHPDWHAYNTIMRESHTFGAPFTVAKNEPRAVNRNLVVQAFLDYEDRKEWLLMADDDQILPENVIQSMMDVGKSIVIGPTPILIDDRISINVVEWTEEGGFVADKYKWPNFHHWMKEHSERDPYRIAVGGTGLILCHRSVFEAIEWPWFEEDHGDKHGRHPRTEDVVFCERVHRAGMEMWCQPKAVCGHAKRVDLKTVATLREVAEGIVRAAVPQITQGT